MSNRIDQLFSDKLADHSVTPRADAWAKVDANLSKKNKAIIWFRWAAALLIPALIAAIIVWRRYESATTIKPTASNPVKKKIENNAVATIVNPAKKESHAAIKRGVHAKPIETAVMAVPGKKDNPQEVEQSPSLAVKNSDKEKESRPEEMGTAGEEQKERSIIPANPATHEAIALAPGKSTNQQINTSPNDIHVTQEKSIVLEYSIGDPVAAPVEKAITLTIELKGRKGFQKVIDFVRDSENSEGPFATIREAKNDLFAFNFKKDKPKNK